jgi:hypothetical protein
MQTQVELKKAVKELNTKRENTLTAIGEVISLAAHAGSIIGAARAQGDDMAKLLSAAGLTDEQGKRLERVAAHQHKLASGDPSAFRQIMLWSEMMPDPITTSTPTESKPFLFPVIRFAQWLSNKGIKYVRQDDRLRDQFLTEAEPIVRAYRELGGHV